MATFGFEVEFIIPDEQVPIYREFMADAERRAPYLKKMDIGTDCNHLVEGKTHHLSWDDFRWSVLDELRNTVLQMIKDIGLSYTYYGTHFSAWDFGDDRLVRCCDLDLFRQYAVVMFQHHEDDVYIDPFVNGRFHDHAIVMVPRRNLPDELWERRINLASYQAMVNLVNSGPSLKNVLAWRPVPGGSIRVCQHSRLELVLGWLPRESEELLIDAMRRAITEDGSTPLVTDGPFVPIFSPKHKYGFSYLSGVTYSAEEVQAARMPGISPDLAGSVIPVFDVL